MTPERTAQAIAALAAGGGWVPIKKKVAANDASVDFVHGADSVVFDGTYKTYVLTGTDVKIGTDGVAAEIRFGNGGSFDSGASDYQYCQHYLRSTGTTYISSASTGTSSIPIVSNIGNNTGEGASFIIYIHQAANATLKTTISVSNAVVVDDGGNVQALVVTGMRNETAAHDRVQVISNSGSTNIASGTFSLWAIPEIT